jgi:hypothetical protein
MKKSEAERVLRPLIEWAREVGFDPASGEQPSFSSFKDWLEARRLSGYLKFRSTMGPLEDAERWFDQELKQTWRN